MTYKLHEGSFFDIDEIILWEDAEVVLSSLASVVVVVTAGDLVRQEGIMLGQKCGGGLLENLTRFSVLHYIVSFIEVT